MTDATEKSLRSAFIVWVYYGYEGWAPWGFDTLEDAQRDVAKGRFSGRSVITGPVLFPPKSED